MITKHGVVPGLVSKYNPLAMIICVSSNVRLLASLMHFPSIICIRMDDVSDENEVVHYVNMKLRDIKITNPGNNSILINRSVHTDEEPFNSIKIVKMI